MRIPSFLLGTLEPDGSLYPTGPNFSADPSGGNWVCALGFFSFGPFGLGVSNPAPEGARNSKWNLWLSGFWVGGCRAKRGHQKKAVDYLLLFAWERRYLVPFSAGLKGNQKKHHRPERGGPASLGVRLLFGCPSALIKPFREKTQFSSFNKRGGTHTHTPCDMQ